MHAWFTSPVLFLHGKKLQDEKTIFYTRIYWAILPNFALLHKNVYLFRFQLEQCMFLCLYWKKLQDHFWSQNKEPLIIYCNKLYLSDNHKVRGALIYGCSKIVDVYECNEQLLVEKGYFSQLYFCHYFLEISENVIVKI